jgi:signal peptidase II
MKLPAMNNALNRRAWGLTIGTLVLMFDLWTKNWALQALDSENVSVIDGLLQWSLAFNRGASFSMMHDWVYGPYKLMAIAVIASVVLVWLLGRAESKWYTIGLGLILGGALGNLVDRVRFGAVVDFIDVYWGTWHFPTFNVADSAITAGVICVLIDGIITKRQVVQAKVVAKPAASKKKPAARRKEKK